MPDAGQQRIFRRQLKQWYRALPSAFRPLTGLINQLHVEAGRTTQAADRRQAAGEDHRIFNLIKRFGGAVIASTLLPVCRTLVPVFERTNAIPVFCPRPAKPKP